MSSVLLQVPLDARSNESVYVEVSPSDVGDGIALVSDDSGRAVAKLARTLDSSLDPVQAFVNTVIRKLRSAEQAPDEASVEFSLKLGGETGFIFAKGSAEAVLKVTAKWTKPVHPSAPS